MSIQVLNGISLFDILCSETNDTAAPALCPRDNSCLFAFVKGADGKVGLYLNLRSTVSGAQTSCKLADVDATAGGTYLCFATIEVGTGKNGAERIRAFGVNVNDVTEQHIGRWAPSDAGRGGAVECELIGETSYPKHLAVGGQDCSPSFRFEEYARHRIARDYPPDSGYSSKQVEYDKSFQASGLFGPIVLKTIVR